jgi:predicted nucleic acid-binding protein
MSCCLVLHAQKREIGEESLLGMLTVLPLSDAAARRAAYLHDERIRRNQDIGIKDVLIAAICLEHGMALLTPNATHFSRVVGLEVITPVEFVA